MGRWLNTKKITALHSSKEARLTHEEQCLQDYIDWYYDQVDAGLAHPEKTWCNYTVEDDVLVTVLVTDQAQADSLIALVDKLAKRTGHTITIQQIVDYTDES